MYRALVVGVLGCVLLSGAKAEAARGGSSRKTAGPQIARKAASRASLWVGLPSLSGVSREVNDDCSGLMHLAYWQPGLSLMPEYTLPGEGGVAAIYRKAQRLGVLRDEPQPGDLVFFQETHDRNRDGRRNDGLTHIGVVVRVSSDGLVTFVHRAGGGVKRSRLHLYQPNIRKDARGRVLNDWLRRRDKHGRGQLAGELLVGFAAVDERWMTPEPSQTGQGTRTQR
jgi:cell wall-associated NlpC family hydrolase